VLAIGNPFGIGETVTSGIVSAKGRSVGILADVEGYKDFIQTDAAINPGNSGGALVDVDGRLVGINTAILSRNGGFQGVGLAVPANMVGQVADSLVKTGKVIRGYLGVGIQSITPALAESFDLKNNKGALVSEVVPDAPAANAGLKGGDVITAVNGQPVTDANDLKLKVSALSPGTKLNLEVLRYGEKTQLNSDASQDGSAWFVRVIDPRHGSIWVKAPPDWVQAVVQRIPIPEWGVTAEREIPTVRLPQDALRDYAVASRTLFDGRLIQAGRSTDSSAVLLAPLRRAFGGVGAAVLILSVAVGTLFAWRATRPLREVSDTARRILETGDFAARVPAPDGSDELAVLVRQLNTLLRQERHARARAARNARQSRPRPPHAAHPAPRHRRARTAGRTRPGRGARCARRLCQRVRSRSPPARSPARHLRRRGRRVEAEPRPPRCSHARRAAADLYREVADEKKITLTLDQPASAELDADAIRLGQAINNLLDNALKYTPASGHIALATRAETNAVVITVTDNGPGVPPAEREAIFRRLYRGDASRSQRGLGLGLSLVKAFVEAHGGTVAIDAALGGGAHFTIRLPR